MKPVRTPNRLYPYLQRVRIFEKVPKAGWETVRFNRLVNQGTKAVHKEFMRQYRVSIRFLNKNKAFERLYDYAVQNHPDLYEKTNASDIRKINEVFEGWQENGKPEHMAEVINNYKVKAGDLGGNRALKGLGFKISFHLRNPEVLEAIKERGRKITGRISRKTLDNFRDTFYRMYMEKGMTPHELRRLVKGMFEETYKRRAFTIARTECGTAQMRVQYQAYKRNGVRQKRWLALVDEKTRPSHVGVDGEVQPIDEPFSIGLMHPLDSNGPAREVINCRWDFTTWQVRDQDLPVRPWSGG